ncbi:response regulator [bacterium]|nr:MAG: response regulator [bacterium]
MKKQVLLVDEDEIFRQVYARTLEAGGYEVVHATGASEAMDKLDCNEIDIIVSEVLLPGRNGLKLLKDIRVRTASNKTPIILLTVLEAADIGLYQGLQQSLNVSVYLVKQKSTPADLVAAIDHSLALL